MKQWPQCVLILSTLLASWLGMQAVHECGHIFAAKIAGATVTNVALHPLGLSRTDVAENSSPLLVVWSGPLFGVLAPLILWILAREALPDFAFLFRFFAGFCLVSNGLYLGLGSFEQIGDCGELLLRGAALWQFWIFAALTVPAGLWLWHGQGGYFGIGAEKRMVDRRAIYWSVTVMTLLIILGVAVGD